MNVNTYHDEQTKVGLILTPFFGNTKPFQKIISLLQDYRLIIPVLSGTEPSSTFTTITREVDLIYTYLRDRQITNLDFILGFSMGANIALELYCRNVCTVRKVILDGTINQHHSKIMQKVMLLQMKSLRQKILSEKITPKQVEAFYPGCHEDIKSFFRSLDEETLKNALAEVSRYRFPKLKYSLGQFLFLYGQKDPGLDGADKLHRMYSRADFLQLEKLHHCAYILKDPEDFLSFLS